MATPFAKSRVGNSTREAQRSVVPSTRAEALLDDPDIRWRRAKRTAAMGGFAIQFGPCFPGSDAMTKVAQQHGSKGMADQRSGPNPWLRPKSWWAPL